MSQNDERVGRVVSVSGAQLVCLLDKAENHDPAMPYDIQTGTLVKTQTTESTVYSIVRGISIPVPSESGSAEELCIAELELVGEILRHADAREGAFQRGVSVFPRLGASVLASTQEDLQRVLACPGVAAARIGSVFQDRSLPAFVRINDLLGKHFAVLGTTGSGKSCAVTVILKAILRESCRARILLLDPHNEYSQAFSSTAHVLDPAADLDLPHWLFNFDELLEIILGAEGEDRAAQAMILAEAVMSARKRFVGDKKLSHVLTVDTPIPYRMTDVIEYVDHAQGNLSRRESLTNYARLLNRLNALYGDSRFAFMFGRGARDNMKEILCGLFRVPVAEKPVTIVNLAGVPSEVMNVVVSLLCRLSFDFALWTEREFPVLLVCEEAHRYAPRNTNMGFEPTKRVLTRIAKEGRKYGVSLCVVSQRPSDMAESVLAECNSIFAMRMTNQSDQDMVRAAVSEAPLGLLEFLPSLRTGEAIAIGEGMPMPVRVSFDCLEAHELPRSETALFTTLEKGSAAGEDLVRVAVERWRSRQKAA
jgi:uncharacterized protein